MKSYQNLKKELLKDKQVAKEYMRLAPRYRIISELIDARIKNGFTQKELADKVGAKQSAIARLESGNINPTLEFLDKIASGMGCKLSIQVQ